ncbi:hypothetical protein SERLADRAFT_397622 [Serpula lacrymans var. lacrymans S7.9]|uniref:Uncharacterized protein n=1 Tax=Serpula lacrymans var. lacrymans (strain S7.9) TaxID=578457 RepID=F8P5W0_SERL9|nr:uncharacterized protein SERLADRAFT_397622 [Serpula lacrymans var. lacrymans S7.9]EGO21997.1 hypothetical protein SERLADRAFT_397622 [Serpula lacrymans var. lacrymans S7.9]
MKIIEAETYRHKPVTSTLDEGRAGNDMNWIFALHYRLILNFSHRNDFNNIQQAP